MATSSDIAFSPSVKNAQERLGSTAHKRIERRGGLADQVDETLAAFIAERDSFYFGTASADGRPYIQHRGGPPGFLHVLDAKTLAFGDLAGNQQYISIGNLAENDRAFIFLMDYPNRRRVKVWGRAEVVQDDPALLDRIADGGGGGGGGGRPQRAFVFHVEAWDVNCPKHITPRFTEALVAENVQKLLDRIAHLEAENKRLRASEVSD